MKDASIWRAIVITITAKLKAMVGLDAGVSNAGRRTNAQFIIACVMQLITILVMLNRSVMK